MGKLGEARSASDPEWKLTEWWVQQNGEDEWGEDERQVRAREKRKVLLIAVFKSLRKFAKSFK